MSEENASNDSIDFDDLSAEQKQAILSNPDVKKSLRYQNENVQNAAEALEALTGEEVEEEEAEAYELLVSGIAERSGRVTESTVQKVLSNLVEEVNSV